MSEPSHIDAAGKARMVDVGGKAVTQRRALATARVSMGEAAFAAMKSNRAAKGDILGVAQIAGINAAKRTGDLIPLCHPLALDHVALSFHADEQARELEIRCEARAEGKTGVEMEAMTAVSIAALTVYDMCKAVDRGMALTAIRLEAKSGGKSGTWTRAS